MKGLLPLVVALVATLPGCGRAGQSQVEVPKVSAVDNDALERLVRGVDAARKPGSRPEAIALLREAVAKDPNLWEARYNLGVVLAGVGELGDAEEHLSEAHGLAPNAEDVVMALAEVRRRRGDAAEAAKTLSAFVDREPEALDARVLLVAALRDSAQLDAAVDQAREVLVRRSGDPNALSELALTYLEKDEVDTAELLSEEALKAKPRPAVAERTAGLIALRRGDDAVAFRHFASASSLDPGDTTARVNMGTVLLRAGIADRAEREFRAVHETTPDDDAAIIGLAAALRAKGRRDAPKPYEEAKQLLEQLLEREPKHLVAKFNLAVLLGDFMGKPHEAKPLFDEYLASAPPTHAGRPYAEKQVKALAAASPNTPKP